MQKTIEHPIDIREQTITMSSPVQKTVKKLAPFAEWHSSLKSDVTKATIDARIKRVQRGLYGDVKNVGDGVCELRIDYGPGYRIYFTEVQGTVVLLLAGGDKSSQKDDMRLAKKFLRDIEATAKQKRGKQ